MLVEDKFVLEVGSLDVNGSIRRVVEGFGPRKYTGVDIRSGPGVDEVVSVEDLLSTFGPETFDLVLSTEMLEHVPDWKSAVRNLKGVLRPGGTLLLTTRSQGFRFHGYPYDFWRFSREDLANIFSDFDVKALEKDWDTSPGVFLVATKPQAYTQRPLDGLLIYSAVRHYRIARVTMLDRIVSRFGTRAKIFLTSILPEAVLRRLRRQHFD